MESVECLSPSAWEAVSHIPSEYGYIYPVHDQEIGRPVGVVLRAQSYRPFGTAAEFTVVPLDHIAPLPESVTPEQGACLRIPGITAHRAVHVGGDVAGRTADAARKPKYEQHLHCTRSFCWDASAVCAFRNPTHFRTALSSFPWIMCE